MSDSDMRDLLPRISLTLIRATLVFGDIAAALSH
jgi:hypothetical protein